MSERPTRWPIWRLLGLFGIVAIGATALQICENGVCWKTHIYWQRVDYYNRDDFEAQVRAELPLGTPKQTVERYLKLNGVGRWHNPHAVDYYHSTFEIERNFRCMWLVVCVLRVVMVFDPQDRLIEIRFSQWEGQTIERPQET